MHERIKELIALTAFIVAAFLAIASLYIPPEGIIDSSALWAIAQFLVMCCTILGIDVEFKKFLNRYGKTSNK